MGEEEKTVMAPARPGFEGERPAVTEAEAAQMAAEINSQNWPEAQPNGEQNVISQRDAAGGVGRIYGSTDDSVDAVPAGEINEPNETQPDVVAEEQPAEEVLITQPEQQ